jgi:putative hemolysin
MELIVSPATVKTQNKIYQDISYAASANSTMAKFSIKLIENITGRVGLVKRAVGYEKEILESNKNFWEVILEKYKIYSEVTSGHIANIPPSGPLIVVSNHPFGILDGLMLGYLIAQRRNDFRIFAHHIFKKSRDLSEIILPINFDATREALSQNLQSRSIALDHLKNGGCIGIFPGGTVSTSRNMFGKPADPSWRRFTAKLIAKSDASVLPIYFHGANSRFFQIASHINYNLRMALLINEFKKRTDGKVCVSIGNILPKRETDTFRNNPHEMMEYLRNKTYSLSQHSMEIVDYGYDYETPKERKLAF